MENFCIISCIFGIEFETLYRAPFKKCSFFFTNNPKLQGAIKRNGWQYVYIDVPISNDRAVSSLQSKYIKFLQFTKLDEYSFISEFDKIIYVDHKFLLKPAHIRELINMHRLPILIRKELALKTTIWDEVNVARRQERYARYMPQTIEYIHEKIKAGYSEKIRICNTGLIIYSQSSQEVRQLVDEVYSALIKIGTSECQIIWALVSQKYKSIIQVIEWEEISIFHKTPLTDIRYWTPRLSKKITKMIKLKASR